MFTKKIPVSENSNYLNESEEGELTVDVYADGDNIVIETLVAGLDSDSLDVSIAHDLVTIKGERKRAKEIPGKNYYYQECFYGEFSRTILLPTDIDPDKAKANFSKNGILTIVMPKVEQRLTSKKLTVEEEEGENEEQTLKPQRRSKILASKEEEIEEQNASEEGDEKGIQNEKEGKEVEVSSDRDWALLSPRPTLKRKSRD
ncbi:MAG: Hsp20/alpha crystallin family protein [Candidatus Parcubacteria bacterium]|nr:Hsp20/alpha crystallin family protein [Candidatus Parcubacteria bacterium]